MPLYENSVCPVCKKEFEIGDDVVFCPECGTPHHRECYKQIGHCANRQLHGTGYDFYEEKKKAQGEADEVIPIIGDSQEKAEKPALDGGLNTIFPREPVVTPYDNNEEKIGENSLSDIAATVRINIPRFIAVFKKQEDSKKKTGWNWGAFFFGSLYYFFRKMYKQGISFMCLSAAVILGGDLAIAKLAPNFSAAMQEVYTLISQGSNEAAIEKYQNIAAISDFQTALTITYATLAALLVIRIILAIFADSFYKKTVSTFITTVTEKLKSGSTFQASVFAGDSVSNLTQEQMKKLYLARKGGVTIFAPLVAIMILDMILRII